MYAEVIIDIAHANVDRRFTYLIPPEMDVAAGQRVLVPFGAGNKKTEGFVLGIKAQAEGGFQIKQLIRTLEPYCVIDTGQIELACWIKENYHCLLVDALRLMIPAQLRGGRIHEKTVRTVCLTPGLDITAARQSLLKKDGSPRSAKQLEVFEMLSAGGIRMSTADITAFVPGAAAAVRALLDKGVLAEYGHITFRNPFGGMQIHDTQPLPLTPSQSEALQAVQAGLNKRDGTFLLHGVTGSGKTEVYMQAIAGAIATGGTAIVLVPEISLTPQAMDRFRGRFGTRVAVLHSRLSAGERFDEWRRIRLGKADVVVGARSAVFAPLSNIRIIIIDEEHEPSYQSETIPRYNALEIASKRCKQQGAVLLLGSATPSLSSYHRAMTHRYTLLELPERINNMPLPKVTVVDMRAEFKNGNTGIFSGTLYDMLNKCLNAKEQAILFINRRGYSTFVSCRGCGYVFSCPNCDVALTYHKLDNLMKCHYCGHTEPIPKVCPECGKPYIKYFGIGTQQVEEQLKEQFEDVSCIRMDMDTTRTKNAHYELFTAFANGEAQVLIGTQMVAKGLDIPNVTLVGVIAADATLHIPDYRSAERTFQLLTQVAGRAGRKDKPGQVIIQTYSPEHPAIMLASNHDYKGYYEYEIAQRRASLFPPYSLFVRILFTGENEDELASLSGRFAEGLRETVDALLEKQGDKRELLFLLSSPSPVKRRQGAYRYQVLLKLARTKNSAAVIDALYAYADAHRSEALFTIEINPADVF